MASLAALVVHYGALDASRACLRSLAAGDPTSLPVLVVNNGPAEDGRTLSREFTAAELVQAPGNVGFGAACNLGIARLRRRTPPPRAVLILNNDCVVPPGVPSLLARALDQDPGLAAVAPKILYQAEPDRLWAAGGGLGRWRALAFNRGHGEPDDGRFDAEQDLGFLPGCAFCARLEAFDRGGGFDEEFFMFAEDAELCARWTRAGLRLRYLPAARVHHHGSASAGGPYDPLQARLRYRNRLLLARKTMGGGRWLLFLVGVLPLVVARDLARHARLHRLAAFRASLAGLRAYFAGERGRPPDLPAPGGPREGPRGASAGPAAAAH